MKFETTNYNYVTADTIGNTNNLRVYGLQNDKNNIVIDYDSTNTSTIVSKLIELTAHYCDSYLSDIVYDINSFVNCVEDGDGYDRLLGFYDGGVHSCPFDMILDQVSEQNYFCNGKNRAVFRLVYDENTGVQALIRCDVYKF